MNTNGRLPENKGELIKTQKKNDSDKKDNNRFSQDFNHDKKIPFSQRIIAIIIHEYKRDQIAILREFSSDDLTISRPRRENREISDSYIIVSAKHPNK